MPALSEYSLQRLKTCDIQLQEVVKRVAEIYDIRILEGRRTNARQEELFFDGKSKLRAGQSKHNPKPGMNVDQDGQYLVHAVDIAPYPIDWNDTKRFVYLAGLMMATAHQLGVNLRWGGNWDRDQVIIDDQNFNDLPHFELVEE